PIDELPGVPSASEFYPSYELSSWQGLFAPAGAPQAAIDRVRAATREVIADKAFDSRLRATLSGKSYQSTPEAFAAQIKSESEKYGGADQDLKPQDSIEILAAVREAYGLDSQLDPVE